MKETNFISANFITFSANAFKGLSHYLDFWKPGLI